MHSVRYSQDEMIRAVGRIAEVWRDPAYAAREAAVARTLGCDCPHTEESLAYAINFRMHQLTPDAIAAWLRGRMTAAPRRVAVVQDAGEPLGGLVDLLAVVLTGHEYIGASSEPLHTLLSSFADDIRSQLPAVMISFEERGVIGSTADALVLRADTEKGDAEVGRATQARHVFATERSFGVAVIDGKETPSEREAFAEDALLFDGQGARSVRVVWAPRGLPPDPYLEAIAAFRGVFPAREGLSGTLKMQKAFLDAGRIPNAHGEGMEFLVSKGEPVPQRPGHVRWAEYDDFSHVALWLRDAHPDAYFTGARAAVARLLEAEGIKAHAHGEANRPELGWSPQGKDLVAFLCEL